MTIKTSLWRIEADKPIPIVSAGLDLEARLEDLIVEDPDLLGPDRLLIIDRQVATSHGKYLDLLAIDEDARLHAIELKRDRTPREVVAQALDYGWWIRTLTLDDVRELWTERKTSIGGDAGFERAFVHHFGAELDDATFNREHKLTIVASSLDEATPRILEYLADDYDVPVNAVLFDYFRDGPGEYLSRTWLRAPDEDDRKPGPKRAHRGRQAPWNGRDVFVPLGRRTDDPRHARWNHGIEYGFVGAGGGAAYWKFLRRLEPGMRVFAYVAGAGYVGVGEVTGPLVPIEDLVVVHRGDQVRFVDLDECPPQFHERIAAPDPDIREYAVPVRWLATLPVDEAFYESGLRAQQLPCKLTHQPTIDAVAAAMGLIDDDR